MSKAVSIAKEQVSAVNEAAMKKAMAAGMLPEAELPKPRQMLYLRYQAPHH